MMCTVLSNYVTWQITIRTLQCNKLCLLQANAAQHSVCCRGVLHSTVYAVEDCCTAQCMLHGSAAQHSVCFRGLLHSTVYAAGDCCTAQCMLQGSTA